MTRQQAAQRRILVAGKIAEGLQPYQAAIAAGYSPYSAQRECHRIANDPTVLQLVAELRACPTAVPLTPDRDRTLRELCRLAYMDPAGLFGEDGKLLSVPQMAPDVRAAVAGYKDGKFGAEVKTTDKIKALEMICKILGMLTPEQGDTTNLQVNLYFPERLTPEQSREIYGEPVIDIPPSEDQRQLMPPGSDDDNPAID